MLLTSGHGSSPHSRPIVAMQLDVGAIHATWVLVSVIHLEQRYPDISNSSQPERLENCLLCATVCVF
jgi:hypothetical protein